MNRTYRNEHKISAQNSRVDNVRNSSRQRKRKNHKKSGFIYLMLIVFIIAAILGVSFTVLFNTENIVVENAAVRYSDETVIAASGIEVGDNMPRMNVSRIASDIKKELPYIDGVKIKRSFDNTVTLSVEYTKASAAIERGTGFILINSNGKVLETGVSECADYIAQIIGVEVESAEPGEKIVFVESDAAAYVTELLAVLDEAGFTNVTEVDVSDVQNVSVEVDYRITAKLGSITSASEKLKFGKKVIDESLSGAASGRLIIDLTDEGAAYVRSEKSIEALKDTMEKTSENAKNGTEGENAENASDEVTETDSGEEADIESDSETEASDENTDKTGAVG